MLAINHPRMEPTAIAFSTTKTSSRLSTATEAQDAPLHRIKMYGKSVADRASPAANTAISAGVCLTAQRFRLIQVMQAAASTGLATETMTPLLFEQQYALLRRRSHRQTPPRNQETARAP